MQWDYYDLRPRNPRVRDAAFDWSDGSYFLACAGMANKSALERFEETLEKSLLSRRALHLILSLRPRHLGPLWANTGIKRWCQKEPPPHAGAQVSWIVDPEAAGRVAAMDMPAAARATRIQLPEDSYHRPYEHWMRALQQQRELDAAALGTASAGVAVAQGADTTADTPAETTGEVAPGPTAPFSAVEVDLPVESPIVTSPVWIDNFPPGCGVNKLRGWLNRLVNDKEMWHVALTEVKPNGISIVISLAENRQCMR